MTTLKVSELASDHPPNTIGQRADIWSRYWATGAQHSCAGSFGNQYEGAIGRWWQQIFEELHLDGRVLDLATGSGAVLQLALKHCTSQAVRLDGVDVGQVAPTWKEALPADQRARVQIHAGVSTESLPFGDHAFDLATSQFGIEYTDLDRTFAEVRRVLRAGGSLHCVLHHAESQSVHLAHVEVDHIRWLLAPSGLLQTAEQLCEPFSRSATPKGRAELAQSQSANALRQRFNLLQDERMRLAGASTCPDVLHEASDAVNEGFRAATVLGVLPAQAVAQGFAQRLRDAEFRLSDLIDHAISVQALGDVEQKLRALGFAVSTGELSDASRLMGWWLRADLPR